jgi:tricorn protease interacting factor F2/3
LRDVNLHVRDYDLSLDLDFRNLRFVGRTIIGLESDRDVILNCSDLEITDLRANHAPAKFSRDGEELVVGTGPFSGKLEVAYTGSIPDALVGIYRAPYDDTYMVTTQFEAAHARSMFPCVDDPEYKAEFRLTLQIDKDLDAISNMPIESVNAEGGRKTVTFQRTPRMSTYLVYLGVGHLEEIRDGIGGIAIIVATTPGKSKRGEFALGVAKGAVGFYQSYFDMPYSLPKIHLISVPEFAAGAMENWGAITFRETALQVGAESGVRSRKRVAEVVDHELAHQWFGDLVTLKWWNDLWLNESFATFMAYKVMDSSFPQWRVWEDFLRAETSEAMVRDSLRNTHPIEVEVTSPGQIEEIFDEISYNKGASIIRMIEEYMGGDNFRRGIRAYLSQYKFSNATSDDLWGALEEASGKRVREIMREWIRRPGYPVVTARIDGGVLKLRQERFLLSGKSEKGIWPIPVTVELDGEAKRSMMDGEETSIEAKGSTSLTINPGRTGFYRVFYRGIYDRVWRARLSALDRWGILSDALAFLLAARMPLGDYLRILRRYYGEGEALSAYEASSQLSLLYSIMPSQVGEISRQFHLSQLKVLKAKGDENSSMLRGIVAGRLAMVDDAYAKELGARFLDYDKVEPDMKDAVALAYARAYGDLEGIVRRYRGSRSDEERVRLLGALMALKDGAQVAISLGLALSGEVKRQDVGTMILAATGNPQGREVMWIWLKTNLARLRGLYEGTGTLSRIFLAAIPILGIGRREEVEGFFKRNAVPEAESGIRAGLEKLEIYSRLAGDQAKVQEGKGRIKRVRRGSLRSGKTTP